MACRRREDSFATFSIRVSTPMRKGGWPSMGSLCTLAVPAAEASIIALRNRREMPSRIRHSFIRRTFFHSRACRRATQAPDSGPDCATTCGDRAERRCFTSMVVTSTGDARRRLPIRRPKGNRTSDFSRPSGVTSSPPLSTRARRVGRFPRRPDQGGRSHPNRAKFAARAGEHPSRLRP